MKKIYVILVVLLLCTAVVIGCGVPATTPAPAPPAPKPAPTLLPTTPTAPTTPTTPAKPPTTAPTTPAKPAAPATPKYGGTLRVIEASAPGSPIGWPPDLAGGAGVTAQICLDQLLHEDRTGKIIPNLASSYEVNTDPKNPSITFYLRKGVKFHDGTDFNAQAVRWNLEMIKPGMNPSTTRWWKSYDVLDDYTIRVNLTGWQNIIVRNFTGITTTLSSPTAYQSKGLEWSRWNMVGTHAFKQVEFVRDVRLRTARFDDYWEQGKPYLLGLDMEYVADSLTRLALFKSGGGDVMGANPKDAADLQKAGYSIISYPAAANVLIPDSINADSPWANAKVRMAAEYAIDKEALSKAFGYGFEPPAYQITLPGSPSYVPSIAGRKYDAARAKQLLAEAGYPNGFKSKIIRDGSLPRDAAVAIQSYLGAIGIQIDLDFVEPAKLVTVTTGTWNNALLFHQTRPFPNFNAVLSIEFGFPVSTFYKSLKKPDGWEQVFNATLLSPTQDPALMQKAVQAMYDDCTVIPTTYYSSTYATQPYVYNTGRGEMGSATQFTPQNAWLSK